MYFVYISAFWNLFTFDYAKRTLLYKIILGTIFAYQSIFGNDQHTVIYLKCILSFLPLLRRFNPAEPVVEKSVIL
jgi:hypothetical protein